MSPLPERRKTPEELAKLRESLGIPAEGPPAGAPGVKRDEPADETEVEALKSAVFESPEEETAAMDAPAPEMETPDPSAEERAEELEDGDEEAAEKLVPEEGEEDPGGDLEGSTEPKHPDHLPAHSLRKSAGLAVDQPKPVRHRSDGSLPARRHTDAELMKLRRIEKGPEETPVDYLSRRTLALPAVISLYALAVLSVAVLLMESLWWSRTPPLDLPFGWMRDWVIQDWYRVSVMGIVGGLAVGSLLFAGWVAWRRPLSRHHAGFVVIMAVLVLVFGTLYFFPNLHGA